MAHSAVGAKWNSAEKVEGFEDEVTLPNGEVITGRYILAESGSATPSHDAVNGFVKSEGFPVDENGETVNDRDYERDKEAQEVTRQMGSNYDSRALQSVPVVSREGVVLSGNGRTMAGDLAARDNTDGAYIDYLKRHGRKFGFSPEQVESMKHPRVVFQAEGEMPYTTETFAKFNAQEMKGQSKTEQAVKLGKTVDDGTFNRIVRLMDAFETPGAFYGDRKASSEAAKLLEKVMKVKGSKVGASGEKMMGRLDAAGEETLRAMRESMMLDETSLKARKAEACA